ncbi:MAG: hypothetical protein LBR53_07805 [Deltaproteobacteria bacterium]|nr:hypothetical protein [Deltaproteobacteria bacterium]
MTLIRLIFLSAGFNVLPAPGVSGEEPFVSVEMAGDVFAVIALCFPGNFKTWGLEEEKAAPTALVVNSFSKAEAAEVKLPLEVINQTLFLTPP